MIIVPKLRRIVPAEYVAYPWKNGLGKSMRIASDGKDPFGWRISLSRIESSGPFSQYSNYQRFLVPLSEGNLRLRHGREPWVEIARLEVQAFSGDLKTEAECERPVDDFNVLMKQDSGTASVLVARFGKSEETELPIAGQVHYLYCVQGSLLCSVTANGQSERIAAGETLEVVSKRREVSALRAQGLATDPTEIIWVTLHIKE
jgi:environmental stress-induced protein Ves